MSDLAALGSNSGSRWNRWEPHVHTPGTVLNDQFRGSDSWEQYLQALENSSPAIRAIGVADYYSLDNYGKVLQFKAQGRLIGCDLVFPNIEMRLAYAASKSWVNLHLLVSPEDPDHVNHIKRFLSRLTLEAYGETYTCVSGDLIRLGQRSDAAIQSPDAALQRGSEQFKVSFNELREAFNGSAWARQNILVAVAAGTNDGTSGISDAADATLRKEVERFADVMFSGNPNDREFWLGQKVLSEADIRREYRGLKPCLHGSDAHKLRDVGVPDRDRYSWVKGDLIFDSLRQACIDPAGRAFVGETPPFAAVPSQVISGVTISDAPWAVTPRLELNPGLIAVIGARGSGKTALADLIAVGCAAVQDRDNTRSFLHRASEYLGDVSVQIDWGGGESETRTFENVTNADDDIPRARYLSQQFVEDLCSSDGMTDTLLHEIERVVFEAHDATARGGATDFAELLDMRATRHRQARLREESALAALSERIGDELEKQRSLPHLRSQINEKTQVISRYLLDREKLVAKGSEQRVARLVQLTSAADKVRALIHRYSNQEQAFLALRDEVHNLHENTAPETLRTWQSRYASSALQQDEWLSFLLSFKGDVDSLINEGVKAARNMIAVRTGKAPAPKAPQEPLIEADATLDALPLASLEAEIARLEALVGRDKASARRFGDLSKKVTEESAALERLKERLADCEQAKVRVAKLAADREASYERVFESVLAEESVLVDLYAPIMTRLAGATGTLNKLAFSVRREADVKRWADAGERLLDLRRQGALKGHGTLEKSAENALRASWETGDADMVVGAMATFRSAYENEFLAHSPFDRNAPVEYRAWTRQFAQWLYSTEHVSVRYSVDYEGLDIRKLSPGTRGIVLLLLYLALDTSDDRPLIIDQPEENLDPKSIFDELVRLFVRTKGKRQVIIVTHNANLVVNTDADQVIIASAGPHVAGGLPQMSYFSGGLERAEIRQAVCQILEGGEEAFRERARRLRIRFER